MKLINRITALSLVMTLNVIAQISNYEGQVLNVFIFVILIGLIVNQLINLIKFKNDFITIGISVIAIVGIVSIYLVPSLGEIYIHHVIVGFYLSLFLIATFPQLFKQEPFTIEMSKGSYPEAVTKTEQFLKINTIMAYIWALLFALSIVFSLVTYSSDYLVNTILVASVPIIIQVSIGVPVTIKLPSYLMQKVKTAPNVFKSINDLFSSMPYGLNKENALGVDTVVQFLLSGEEPTTCYFIIKDQKCSYNEGQHHNPNTTIKSDSALWLQISNGEVSGDKAYMEKAYIIEGDATIMLTFGSLFAPPSKKDKVIKQKKTPEIKFKYKTFEQNKVKTIVVFDGGPRTDKFSKTTFMTNSFTAGAKEAGASVEYIKLKDYEIKDCIGCYQCWTKTPGDCIHKDDMTELRKKYREADLVVFATPLYIFNVTGVMKRFMDRLLPTMKPYMIQDEFGNTMHPDRFPENGEHGFVVFSAAGFPEVKHNFDGLTGMYHSWNAHSENCHMAGEFYLTAAESIFQPVYENRLSAVKDACYEAGNQIVTEGYISTEYMDLVQDPGVSKETFRNQADMFWGSLEGKKSFLASVPKLK